MVKAFNPRILNIISNFRPHESSQLIIKALHGFILKLRLSFKKQIKVIKIFAIRTKNHTYIKRISISAKSAASVKLLETQMLSPNGCKIKQYSKQLERILFFS